MPLSSRYIIRQILCTEGEAPSSLSSRRTAARLLSGLATRAADMAGDVLAHLPAVVHGFDEPYGIAAVGRAWF